MVSTSDSIPGDHRLIHFLQYLSIVLLCADRVLVKSAAKNTLCGVIGGCQSGSDESFVPRRLGFPRTPIPNLGDDKRKTGAFDMSTS